MFNIIKPKPKARIPVTPLVKSGINEISYEYSFTEQFGRQAFVQKIRQYFTPSGGGLQQQIFSTKGKLLNQRHFMLAYTAEDFYSLWQKIARPVTRLATTEGVYDNGKYGQPVLKEKFKVVLPRKELAQYVGMPFFQRFSSAAVQLMLKTPNEHNCQMVGSAYEEFLNLRATLDREFYHRVPRKEVKVDASYRLGKDESLLVLVNDFIVDTVKDYAYPELRQNQNYLLAEQYQIKVVKARPKSEERRPKFAREVLFERETSSNFSKIDITPGGIDLM